MIKYAIRLSAILLAFSLSACSPLLEVSSLSDQVEDENDSYRYSSSDYNLSWDVSNSATHIRLKLITNYPITIQKILQSEFSIYLSESEKKNTAFGITYPIAKSMVMQNQEVNPNKKAQRSRDPKDFQKRLLNRLSKDVIIETVKGNKDTEIDTLPKGYSIRLSFNEFGYLLYEVSLPIKDFHIKPLIDNEITIGLVSGVLSLPELGGTRPRSQGGAMRPGDNTMNGNNRPTSMQQLDRDAKIAEMQDPIKIWFKTKLAS